MTDIPVFDNNFCNVLGYLDSSVVRGDALRDHSNFEMAVYDELGMPPRPDERPAAVGGIVTKLAFAWQVIGSFRRTGDRYMERGRHRAFVLQVDDPSLLGKVKGFKWFAERHGDIVREPRLAVEARR